MSKRKSNKVKNRTCDPGLCDHCIYACEGDFLCDKYTDETGAPLFVMTNWESTIHHEKCKRSDKK